MALTKEQITQIKSRLREIKSQPQGRFLYCQEGSEGDPVLLLDKKRIAASEIKKLRASARKKKFVRGFVEHAPEQGGYVFRTRGEPPPHFARNLKAVFARAIPVLRGAVVEPLRRLDGVEAADGDDVSWHAGPPRDGASQGALLQRQKAADDAAHEQETRQQQAAQLQAQLDALQQQRLSASFEAERAMDRFESAAGSFNPFKRRKRAKRRAEAEHARDTLAGLEAVIASTQEQLHEARDQALAAKHAADDARAEATDLLSRWGRSQEQFWTAHRADPSWLGDAEKAAHSHAEARDVAETARNAWLAAREALDEASAQRDAADKQLELNDEEIDHLQQELEVLSEKPQLSLADVRLKANLQERIESLLLENDRLLAALEDAQGLVPVLEGELFELTSEKEVMEARAASARIQRDRLYMSAEEAELFEALHHDQDEARDELVKARGVQATCRAQVDELRAGLDGVNAARRGLEKAQVELFAAQIEREHQEEEAGLFRIPGLRGRRDRIDAGRAALPGAKLAEDKARRSFEEARAALQAAEAAEAPRVQAINEATEALLIADRHAAEAGRRLAEVDHHIAEGEARIVGWAEDVQRQQLEAKMATLAASDGAFMDAWQDRDAAADVAAEMAEVLIDLEEQLAETQAEIRELEAQLAEGFDPTAMHALQELLAELPVFRSAIDEAITDADEAAVDAEAAQALFDQVVQGKAREDVALQGLLDDYRGIRSDLKDNHQLDASAQQRLVGAEEALAEAGRRDRVHALNTEAQAFIGGSQELLRRFHRLDEEGDVHSGGVILDLLAPKDRARAQEMDDWPKLEAFFKELERYASEILRKGATVEELSAMLEAVPNGLRPPAYRAEVRAFANLQSALELTSEQREQRAVLKAARQLASPDAIKDGIREKLQSITDARVTEGIASEARVDALTGKVEALLNNPLYSEVPEVLGKVEDALGYLGEGLAIVQADEAAGRVGQAKARYNDVTTSFVDSVLDLKERGVDLFAAIKPVLDTLKGPVDRLANDIIATSVRRGQARHTRLLAQAAKTAGSPLAGAFEEAVARENALWARYAVSATMDTVDIVGKILLLYPEGASAAVGAALQIGAAGVRSNLDLVSAVAVDWDTAKKARSLLAKAKKGDPRAKAELTRYHPLYAKGLIAHMAREGDPFATLYVTSRGIDEARIQKSSARILAHYLLDDAHQLDGDGEVILETRREWWERKKADWTSKLVAGLHLIQKALLDWRKSEAARNRERMLSVRRAASELAGAVEAGRRVRARLEAQLARATKDALSTLTRQIDEVTQLLESYRQTFTQVRKDCVLGLEALGRVEREVAVMEERAGTGGLRPDALVALQQHRPVLPELRSGYLEVVENVSRAA